MENDSITAEELAQRVIDVGIIEHRELQPVWGEFGSQQVPVEDFQQAMVRRGLLTNYQLDRLIANYRDGYFYGDYKVLYAVGAGTFARVYRATHIKTGKQYAVKVLRRRFSNIRESVDNVSNKERIESFLKEGELGAALQHPNIVPVHEVFSRGLVHYIVMDFVEGRNLREFWKSSRQFDCLEATKILIDMLAGLTYAHQKGVTHRDLKMSNVLVSSNGRAQLVDFGLAALDTTIGESDDDLESFTNQRTIDYAGLERSTGAKKGDVRSDIFFAGCIYYQLLTGKPPMSETRDRIQRLAKSRYQEIPQIREIDPSVSLPVAVIVNRAIEFDPNKRYQAASEMWVDLKQVAKRLENKEDHVEEQLKSQEGHDADGNARTLMIVESDHKMQNVFRDLFKRKGYRVLVTSDPERALERFQDDPQTAELVLISSGTIGNKAVETFNALAEFPSTKKLPTVLLLGKRQAEWEESIQHNSQHRIAVMPLKARDLRLIVAELLAV